jgi:hypothetical protein
MYNIIPLLKDLSMILLLVVGIYVSLMVTFLISPIVIGYFIYVNRKLNNNNC